MLKNPIGTLRVSLTLIALIVFFSLFTVLVLAAESDCTTNVFNSESPLMVLSNQSYFVVQATVFFAVLALAYRLGGEVQRFQAHQSNTQIHTELSELQRYFVSRDDFVTQHNQLMSEISSIQDMIREIYKSLK